MGRIDKDNIGRIIIVSDSDYPELDATSNYIRNFAKSLALAGKEVKIISVDRNAKRVSNPEWKSESEYISFLRFPYPVSSKVDTLISRSTLPVRVWKALKDIRISNSDRIVLYTQKYAIADAIIKKCKKKGIKVSAIVVEWFEGKNIDQDKCYEKAYTKCDSIIAISKNISQHFEDRNIPTLIIPPMVDVGTLEENDISQRVKKCGDKVRFLYTGNFVGKDDMKVMLEALSMLSEEEKSKIEFHITRFDDISLINASEIDVETWNRIKNVVFTHGDVSKEELQNLLAEADFLPVARQKNRTTISNFPSKVPEAMAMGIVPIMTRVGDCSNVFLTSGDDSILFDECTSVQCLEAFRVAIKTSEFGWMSQMKINAKKTAETKFDISIYCNKIKEWLDERT